ncbi:hypothetical protein SKAU_G00159880 [Synaphobranchus kaupii]|uniref:Uncharacterized protein n=1 Tax=Synaphobranchus kaupii TaxID=118154 RepID=A0A9Q1IZB0_SYNKA|nr:hypothetical protein SKAU_G00159880 [Synaphobranchus kaupii]
MTSITSVRHRLLQWTSDAFGWRRQPTDPTGKAVRYLGLAQSCPYLIDGPNKTSEPNNKLLSHFRELAKSTKDESKVDLEYLDGVISEGADVNTVDSYGQTALHEISGRWPVDVMCFFLDRGADVQRADNRGVTPLHVAAALDREEMIHFLLEKQANIEARIIKTKETPLHFATKYNAVGAIRILLQLGADITARDYKQRTPLQLAANQANIEARIIKTKETPLHFATKYNAVGAIRILLQLGADITARDYKQRTPLQLAANQDRSEAARTLIKLGADARVCDSDGQLCITAMIGRMAPVAQLALNQFHATDSVTGRQTFYLHLLEPKQSFQDDKGRKGY